MGGCGSKPASGVIAEPPSVFDLTVREQTFPQAPGSSSVLRNPVTMKLQPVDCTPEALVERCLQLELENARLREHLQLLAGAQATGQAAPESAPPLRGSALTADSPGRQDDPHPNAADVMGAAVREAELEAEAADLSSNLRVQIEPEPQDGCTVIRVQAPDRQQLLATTSHAS